MELTTADPRKALREKAPPLSAKPKPEDLTRFLLGSEQRKLFTDTKTDHIDIEKRLVTLSFSSEAPYERWWGIEILSHERGAPVLERISTIGTLHFNHDRNNHIGSVEKVWLEGGRGHAIVRFSKSQRAEEIFQDVIDGILKGVSVGYRIIEMILSKMSDDGPDEYTVTRWEPLEISIVTIPADITVGVGRSYEEFIREFPISSIQEIKVMAQKAGAEEPGTQPTQPQSRVTTGGESGDASRVRELYAIARDHGGMDEVEDFVDRGASASEFSRHLLKKRQNPVQNPAVPQTTPEKRDYALGLSEREVGQFSILRAIDALMQGDPQRASFEFECSEAAKKKAKRDSSNFLIPIDVLMTPMGRGVSANQQRLIQAQNPQAPTYLVPSDIMTDSFIDVLRSLNVVLSLGGFPMRNLAGNVSLPRAKKGGTAQWVDEGTPPQESAYIWDQVSMKPRSLSAYIDLTRKLMIQAGNFDVEAFIRRDMARELAGAMDRAIIYGAQTDDDKGPRGIIALANDAKSGVNVIDAGSTAITWRNIVDMETLTAEQDADVGSMAYVVPPSLRGFMKYTLKQNNVQGYLWDGNNINGYNAVATTHIPAVRNGNTITTTAVFGSWSSVILGEWGPGIDLQVNPYILGTAGIVRVRVLTEVDYGIRYPESFTVLKGIKISTGAA